MHTYYVSLLRVLYHTLGGVLGGALSQKGLAYTYYLSFILYPLHFTGGVLLQKGRAEAELRRSSGLDWAILRPGLLQKEAVQGGVLLGPAGV